MMSFKPVVLGLVLSAVALSPCAADTIRARRLAEFPVIAGYQPQGLVTDHNAIDLDVRAMDKALSKGQFGDAHHIYKDGGYGKVYASLTLTEPLDSVVPVGTRVKGKAHGGGDAKGRTLSEAKVGATSLQVQYRVHSDQDAYVECQVGALWRIHEANLDGCYEKNSGTVHIENIGVYNYTYDIRKDNHAGRTLAMISNTAESDMMRCEGCPYPTFEKFYDYYGKANYANEFVNAAFNSSATSFKNGNIDFTNANNKSRAEGVQKGAVALNIWMAVIRKMEDALAECKRGSSRPKTLSWDEAVAFYTGSLEGTDGKPAGKLLHELADSRCANFHTCGADAHKASGHAKVNHEIFQQFKFGQRNLVAGNCDGARENKELIETRMVIPMIQGTLRYAHIQSNPDTASQKAAAEGASFAAAVLPIVQSCNERHAEAIYANMNLGASSTSFYHVKNALQETYSCMGVTCEDVGGYYDAVAGEYFEGAEPCTGSGSSGANALGVAVGVIIAVVAVVGAAVFVARRRRTVEKVPRKNPIFVTPEEPFT